MSDPQPDRLKPRPRRAEPLQPDKPGSGDEAAPSETDSANGPANTLTEQEKEQLETVRENITKGYD